METKDNSLISSKELWQKRKYDGVLHCAFCNDKDWLWENIELKFIACNHCRDMFEHLTQEVKSSTQKEIDELKDQLQRLTIASMHQQEKLSEFKKQLSEATQTERERILKIIDECYDKLIKECDSKELVCEVCAGVDNMTNVLKSQINTENKNGEL